MRRRGFLAGLGTALAWPVVGLAQQSTMPMIGFVNNGSSGVYASLVAVFQKGLEEAGYAESQSVTVEYRWADGDNGRLANLINDLLQKNAALIVATGGTATAIAARAAATSVPVVFAIGADPIKFGFVASLNRPGGNMTGATFLANSLLAKQIEILHEAVGNAAVIGFLVNPANPNADADTREVMSAAVTLRHRLVVERAKTQAEMDAAFANFVQKRIDALLIFPDALFTSLRTQLLRWSAANKIPALYNSREFAVAGGLIGYGAKQTEAYRVAGRYAGRILRGDKPADLPVVQSSSVELIVNLKTAKALGLEMPQTLLARADEVIE